MNYFTRSVGLVLCVTYLYLTFASSYNLIWKPFSNGVVPDGCVNVFGQTEIYFGLVHFSLAAVGIEASLPTTIVSGSPSVNVTLNKKVYTMMDGEIDMQVLCGVSDTEGKIDFVSLTSNDFSSLFNSDDVEPIQLGWENYQVGLSENWYNASLYAGFTKFTSSDESNRVAVGKIYRNANEGLNNNLYLADLHHELEFNTYTVLVLKKT